jgi:HK97 family phage portal protein
MALLAKMAGVQAGDPNDERYWTGYAPLSLAGVSVTAESAMKISACWACVRLISHSLASIPLITYRRRTDGGRDRALGNPLYELLHTRPNPRMTAFEFKRLLTVHALLRGNGYAYIRSGPRGFVDALEPIHPDLVHKPETAADGTLIWPITQADGQVKRFPDDQIFHLTGLSFDGVTGVSVIDYARESMGLALATESYGERFFSQNATPSVALRHPGKPNAEARRRIRDEWEADTSGLRNAHRAVVLAEGMDVSAVGVTSEDAQFLQTREFQVQDLARWFGVPLHMIQQTTGSTSWGTGLEQMSQGFVTYTLLPWATLWEQAISRDLILAEGVYYAEYLFDALVRADQATRKDYYATGIEWGWLSLNDVRRMENMNPVEGGDSHTSSLQQNRSPAPQPPLPELDTDAPATSHYRALLAEAAGRVVRKEIAALTRAGRRAGDDAGEWTRAVDEFYADHAAFVAQSLRLPLEIAESHVAQQRETAYLGLPALLATEAESVRVLIELALSAAAPEGDDNV